MKTAKKLISLALSAGLIGSVFTGTLVQRVSAAAEYTNVGFETESDKSYFEALGAESDEAWGIVDVPLSSIRNGAGNTEDTKALKLTLNGNGTYTRKNINLQESDRDTAISYAIYRFNTKYMYKAKSISGKFGLPEGAAISVIADSTGNLQNSDAITLANNASSSQISVKRNAANMSYFWANKVDNTNGISFASSHKYEYKATGNDPIWVSFKVIYTGTYAMLYYSASDDISDWETDAFENEENKGKFGLMDLKYSSPGFALISYATLGGNVLATQIEKSVAFLDELKITNDIPESLPEIIDFETSDSLDYFEGVDGASGYSIAKSTTVTIDPRIKEVIDNNSGSFLKIGGDSSIFMINPIYTAGKNLNTVDGKIGIAVGNQFYIIYDYTDSDNWKGFKIVGEATSIRIESCKCTEGTVSTVSRTDNFITVNGADKTEISNQAYYVKFFDFKLTRSVTEATLTVNTECYKTNTTDSYIPSISGECSNTDYLVFKGARVEMGGLNFIDDLRLYTEDETVCTHNFVETSRTDADYLTAGEIVKTCSKCKETETETIYAYADFNKDGKVDEADLESFNAESADTELFSFDGVDGISEFDKTVVKLLTKNIDFKQMINANGDDSSDILDLVRMKKILAGAAEGNADRNGDGNADSSDIAFVRMFLMMFSRQELLK